MKITKKIIAIAMAAIMLVLPCVPANASASVTMTQKDAYTVVDGVEFKEYSIYGSQSGHTETTTILEFNPADGYIPMAFASNAGSVTRLSTQYNTAVNKYGYEVAGVINGSFFDTKTGTLTGMLISGGKVACADIGYTVGNVTPVVAFGYDGSMNIVDSQLAYELYLNGSLVQDAFRFFNKKQDSDSWRTNAIYYYDTSCGSIADSSYGYHVLCKKVNNTDLVVGEKMVAEVVKIYGYTEVATIESDNSIKSDNFVLCTLENSSYIDELSSLSVGDKVEVTVEETIAESVEIMENASSVITNVGTLVKDGVDLTDSNSIIGGDHYVASTYACWTAFGQKPDGTYVFFTSGGGSTGDDSQSLTLKDVAAAMIKLGCTNVIRMDGGGSTSMYVSNTGSGYPGYKMVTEDRAVADCILIVKNNASRPALKAALSAARAVSYTDYTAKNLDAIRDAYAEAEAVYYNENSTDADYAAAAEKLNALVAKSGPSSMANGDQFWLTHYNEQAEGAGVVITKTESYTLSNWWYHAAFAPVEGTSAYEIVEISNGFGGSGDILDIPEGGFVYALNKGNPPKDSAAAAAMAERVSEWTTGDQFIFTGLDLTGKTVPTTTPSVDWYASSYNCTAKIAPYDPSAVDDRVSNGVYITGFNSYIYGGDATIFTSDFNGGKITVDNANHKWTHNVVLQWDYSVGAYRVISSAPGDGAAPDIELEDGMILIAVHNGGGTSTANNAILAQAKEGQVLNLHGIDIDTCDIGVASYLTITERVDSPILYQKYNHDIRLVTYVDDYEAYSSVTFSLVYEGEESKAVKCTTAYAGLYANGILYTTKDIYGKEGYFVALTIEDYLAENDDGWSGEQMTFVATYTTVTGETIRETRTLRIE